MATTTLLTAAEFLAFPETLHKPELVQGEIVEMAPVGGYHGDAQLRCRQPWCYTWRNDA